MLCESLCFPFTSFLRFCLLCLFLVGAIAKNLFTCLLVYVGHTRPSVLNGVLFVSLFGIWYVGL